MEQLLDLASRYGIAVHVCKLPDDLLGCWVPELKRVFLDSRLTRFERRTVLAHELGHVHHNHACARASDDSRNHRQEFQADRFAARLLIDARAFVKFEEVNADAYSLADAFEVTVEVIDVYRRSCLTQVHGATYAFAREGAGQWDHRQLHEEIA